MGRGKELPAVVRSQVLTYRHDGKSYAEIDRLLGIPKTTVVNTVQRFNATGSVLSGKRSGRPSKLSPRDRRSICVMVKKNRRLTSTEVAQHLHQRAGIQVATSTIRRALIKYGLCGRLAKKKPFISIKNRQLRLRFARAHLRWTTDQWNAVLFTDEKKFNLRGSDSRTLIRRRRDEAYLPQCLQGTVKNGGASCMAWVSFSGHCGPGPMTMLSGKVNAKQYIENVLEVSLLPYVHNLPLNWTLQQDNAPIHTANIVKRWLHTQDWSILDHPPQSPDLNPIENLWTRIDKEIKRKAPNNVRELEAVIRNAWSNISMVECQNLSQSMPKRCLAVIKNCGYPTKY